MSKFLSRANVSRDNAEHNYQNLALDDAFLDACCFNLHQTIEFSLKYIVEMNGEEYVENHDVRAQLNKLKAIGVDLPMYDEIRRVAATLNSWEIESRYNDNFTALLEDIDEVREIADKVLSYARALVKEI